MVKTHKDVTAGDKVLVFDVNGERRGDPEGGWPGEVVKAGPKVVRVKYEGGSQTVSDRENGKEFRRESGRANDRFGHQWFVTPQEHEELTRRRDTFNALYAAGVEFSSRQVHKFSTAKLEAILAAVQSEETE